MVTKAELDKSIETLSNTMTANFKKMLDDSIQILKDTIIDNLKKSNENLQQRVILLEKEVNDLKTEHIEITKRSEAAFQHGRLNQIIISGIPSSVGHDELEETSRRILNEIKQHKVAERDVAACHRLGKNGDTILRFVNRKDAEESILNGNKLKNLDGEKVGLTKGKLNIYINQNLSPFMNKLAYYCRVLKRHNLIEKVTTFKGVIKIFRQEGTVKSIIGHKHDLLKLFPNLDALVEAES